jgi:DNA-binding protein H-NS
VMDIENVLCRKGVLLDFERCEMPRQLSAATIRARIRALETQAQKLERGATKGLRATAALIGKYGLSLSDLRQAFAMSKGRGRRSSLAGRPVPAKYRDDKGNTWSGRGRPPLWLVAAEKAGKRRDSFLIGAKKPATRNKRATKKRSSKKRSAHGAPSQPAG